MKKVAFVCVHNSCRSQMAEAIAKLKYSGIIEAYSAGTDTSRGINSQAVEVIKEIYGIDMQKTQYSKLIDELPKVDIVVTMGCNVKCPLIACGHREDWGLDDPSGQDKEIFLRVIAEIEKKMSELAKRIENGLI